MIYIYNIKLYYNLQFNILKKLICKFLQYLIGYSRAENIYKFFCQDSYSIASQHHSFDHQKIALNNNEPVNCSIETRKITS